MARSTSRSPKASRLFAALVAVGLLGACQDDGGGDRSGPTTTAEASMTDYATRVSDAVGRFRSTIALVAGAKSYTDLQTQLTAAVPTLRNASAGLRNLSGVPAGTKSAHDRLVARLTDLQFEVISAQGAVDGQDLCAASSVIARLNNLGTPGKVDAAAQELSAVTGGQLKADPVVPVVKASTRRPASGTVVRGRLSGPKVNYLTIDNKDGLDKVLTLAKGKDGKKPFISVYSRGKSKVTIRGIPNGTYRSHGTEGKDWDGKLRQFARVCDFWKYKGKESWKNEPGGTIGWTYEFGGKSSGESGSDWVPPGDAVLP